MPTESAHDKLRRTLRYWQEDRNDCGTALAEAVNDYLGMSDPAWQPIVVHIEGDGLKMDPACPIGRCDWGTSVFNIGAPADVSATDVLALILGLVEHLQEDHLALLPGSDEPTKTPQAVTSFADLTMVIDYVIQTDESGVPVPDSVLAAVERIKGAL